MGFSNLQERGKYPTVSVEVYDEVPYWNTVKDNMVLGGRSTESFIEILSAQRRLVNTVVVVVNNVFLAQETFRIPTSQYPVLTRRF